MTGLLKILKTIDDEADQRAEKIISEAKEKAADIVEKATRRGTQEALEIIQKAEQNAKEILERGKSSDIIESRKRVLESKTEIIENVISDTLKYLQEMPDKEYFNLILKMIESFSSDQKGMVVFSKKDLKNIPEGFEASVSKIAKDKGGDLKISSETRDIDGGFILVYGDIEQNCSFKALIESNYEVISDKIAQILF